MAQQLRKMYAHGRPVITPAGNLTIYADPSSGRGQGVEVQVPRIKLKELRDTIDAYLKEGEPLEMAQEKLQQYKDQLEREREDMIAVKRKELATEHGVDEDELD